MLTEQHWYRFTPDSVREIVPSAPGIFAIGHLGRVLLIAETKDLQGSLLRALPPLGYDVELTTRLASYLSTNPGASLEFCCRLVSDEEERKGFIAAMRAASPGLLDELPTP